MHEKKKISQPLEFLKFYLPAAAAVILVVSLLFYNHRAAFLSKIASEEQSSLLFEKHVFENTFNMGILDVVFLSNLTRMHLEDSSLGKDERLGKIEEEFLAFAKSRPSYWQIRFMETSGRERVRINQTPAGPEITPRNRLQDKSARTYFKKAIKLEKSVYISKFDLNIENEKIEIPFKPTFRIVFPLTDSEGKKLGLVALNYFGENLLNKLGGPSRNPVRKVYLVNENGYWLKGPAPEDEWGFALEKRRGKSMAVQMPEGWNLASKTDHGQERNREGLFTFATVDFSGKKLPDNSQAAISVVSEDSWKIISHVPPNNLVPAWYPGAFWALGCFLLILFFFIWQWSRDRCLRLEAMALLKESERKFRQMSHSVQDAVIMIDTDGKTVFWSDSATRMFGYKAEETIDKDIHSFTTPMDQRGRAHLAMASFKATGTGPIIGKLREVMAIKKDGTTFPAELSITTIQRDNKTYALGTVRDISERKQAREKIELLKKVVEQTADIIFICGKDGRIEYVNKAFSKITGFSKEDVLGKNPRVLKSGEMPPPYYETVWKTIMSGQSISAVVLNRRKNGELFYYDQTITPLKDEQDRIIKFISTGKDITERKKTELELERHRNNLEQMVTERTEELKLANAQLLVEIDERINTENALKKSEGQYRELSRKFQGEQALLRSLIDSIPDLIFYKDISGRYLGCNRAFQKFSGKSESELIGSSDADIFSEKEAMFFREKDLKAIASGTVAQNEEWIDYPDGRRVLLDTLKTPFFNSENKLLGLIGVSRDITVRKQAELELLEARSMAESANKAKSEFLARMSHEIRTPMNAIIGMSHLALRTDLTVKQQDYLEKIRSASHTLMGIINDILDFSKIEAGKLELESTPFNLEAVLGNLANMMDFKTREKGLEFFYDIPEEIPEPLVGDPLRLEQVLLNLVGNAIKFTHKGEIVLSVLIAEKEENRVALKFSVRDTGIGISSGQMDQLFKPFSQADGSITRKFGGTGLGLVISRKLVQMMGGTLKAESEPDKGSVFTFIAMFKCQVAEVGKKKFSMPGDLVGLKTLMIDDNPMVRKAALRMLKSFSLDVIAASSGREAIRVIQEAFPEKPFKLVLVDLKMDGMDGIQTIREIKSLPLPGASPRIVLVTGFGNEDQIRSAKAAGADDIILKPFARSMLFDTIVNIFGQNAKIHSEIRVTPKKKNQLVRAFKNVRVLLVEDNAINRQVGMEFIKFAGCEVTAVENGLEAVEAIQKADYDLVFMDIQMPVMDGLTAARKIRELESGKKETIIIAMTANAMLGDREKSIAAGMNDHISKPIKPGTLIAVMSKWVGPKQEKSSVEEGIIHENDEEFACNMPENPVLPGIDTEKGLRHTGGNRRLYESLLGKFLENHIRTGEEIREALETRDMQKAIRLAHTLKSVSGTLGADGLHQASEELETRLQNPNHGSPESMLPILIHELKLISGVLEQHEKQARLKIPGNEIRFEPITPNDLKRLEQLLEKFEKYLADYDTRAMNRLDQIKSLLAPHGVFKTLGKLTKLTSRYEFDDASDQLGLFKKELDACHVIPRKVIT